MTARTWLLWLIGACAPLEIFDDPTKVPPGVPTVPADRPADTGERGAARDTGATRDRDDDGVVDRDDNCVDDPNTDQLDADLDAVGDVCDDDRDGDQIPNDRDLFPDDRELPGVASQDHVFAHGPSSLHRLDVPRRALSVVGDFRFDQQGGSVTDVAIDRYGVLYAVTFYDAFVCNPHDARCWWIGDLPGSYNGLTFVPDDTDTTDVLVGISTGGTWTVLQGVPFGITPASWGGYGAGYSSSGDAFYVRGTGAYAAVNSSAPGVEIVEVDTHGHVQRSVASIEGLGGVYGVAGWADLIFAFTSGGSVMEVAPDTGVQRWIAHGPSWWGAGVKTIVVP